MNPHPPPGSWNPLMLQRVCNGEIYRCLGGGGDWSSSLHHCVLSRFSALTWEASWRWCWMGTTVWGSVSTTRVRCLLIARRCLYSRKWPRWAVRRHHVITWQSHDSSHVSVVRTFICIYVCFPSPPSQAFWTVNTAKAGSNTVNWRATRSVTSAAASGSSRGGSPRSACSSSTPSTSTRGSPSTPNTWWPTPCPTSPTWSSSDNASPTTTATSSTWSSCSARTWS